MKTGLGLSRTTTVFVGSVFDGSVWYEIPFFDPPRIVFDDLALFFAGRRFLDDKTSSSSDDESSKSLFFLSAVAVFFLPFCFVDFELLGPDFLSGTSFIGSSEEVSERSEIGESSFFLKKTSPY